MSQSKTVCILYTLIYKHLLFVEYSSWFIALTQYFRGQLIKIQIVFYFKTVFGSVENTRMCNF